MRYFHYMDTESQDQPIAVYVALDDEAWPLQALFGVTVAEAVALQWHNSSLNVNHPRHGLPEVCMQEFVSEMEEISAEVFHSYWRLSLEKQWPQWLALQQNLALGQSLTAKIVCFYPQGVIADVGLDFYAWLDYDECLAWAGKENMRSKHEMAACVSGFDNENLWIKLKHERAST